jgi:hypothetical protein
MPVRTTTISGVEKSAERNIEAGNKYLRYLITTYINDPAIDARQQVAERAETRKTVAPEK